MKFKNIAISGLTGSGKSTLAKKLAANLGWEFMSTGNFIRKWQKDNDVPFLEPDKIPEEVDKKIDYGYQELMKNENGMVFESRLAGWLSKNFPETFKVLMICNSDIAAQRISNRDQIDGQQAMKEAEMREGLLREKFIRLYDAGDYLDEENFDMVIDTAKVGADEAMQMVLDKLM
jgi:predicted cytidylate kinase